MRVSNPSALGAVEYEAETLFGEDVATFAEHRIPVLGAIDVSTLAHEKVAPERVVQRRNDGTQWVLMTQSGTFKTKIDLAGHGTTTAGSPTIDPIETLLGLVIGNVSLSAAQSSTLTGGTAAVPLTTASGTFAAGGLCRIGTLGDGRGGGQFYAIAAHAANSLNLLGALPDAPANNDVIYPVAQIYPSEDPTDTEVQSVRLRVLTANLRYELHGCYPTAIAITGLSPGERPQIEITWGVSWWRYSMGAFPSLLASNQYNPAPIAAGSLCVQDLGVTARNARQFRSLTLEHTLGVEAIPGPGGASPWQKIVGARRTPDRIKLTWVEDADAATLAPVLPGWAMGQTYKHIEYTGSTSPGSAFGFRAPRAAITSVPIQMADSNVNRLRVEAELYTGTDHTSELTHAAIIYGLA